jgi:Fe-S-cluster containining protein
MVHEDELKQIAKATGRSYGEVLGKTTKDKNPGRKHFRFIKYPCMFYSATGCTAYGKRPTVCRVFPVTTVVRQDKTSDVKINIRCDYGRDIYKALHKIMVQQG